MLNNINTGTIPNPYREFTYTIPAGLSTTIYYDYDSFRVLATNLSNALEVNFGGSGGQTTIEAGIGYKLDFTASYVQLFNTNGKDDLVVKFAMGIGTIDDSRLTVSGSVSVQNTNEGSLNTNTKTFELLDITEHTIAEGGTSVTLDPNGATFTRVQNSGTNTVRLYSATGFLLLPNSTEELTLDAPFTVHGVAGDKVVFGRFA